MLALATLTAGAAGAAYLQEGHDAARTGALDDAGPEWDDVAWNVRLPGSRANFAPPLIEDGHVHVLTADRGMGAELREAGIWRIRVSDAAVERVARLARGPMAWAADAERFYVGGSGWAAAHDRATGEERWSLEFPGAAGAAGPGCVWPAVREETLFLACAYNASAVPMSSPVPVLGYDHLPDYRLIVAAVDAETGAPRWTWFPDGATHLAETGRAPHPSQAVQRIISPMGLSVVGPYVFVTASTVAGTAGAGEFYLWALDAASGDVLWNRTSTADAKLAHYYWSDSQPNAIRVPTGTPEQVYAKLDGAVVALNPARGEDVWRQDIRRTDRRADYDIAAPLAFDGNAVFAASPEAVTRLDPRQGDILGTYRPPERDAQQLLVSDAMLVAQGVLYARTTDQSAAPQDATQLGPDNTRTRSWITAWDVASERTRWSREFALDEPARYVGAGNRLHMLGAAEGVMAVAGVDGTVTLLGRTPMSLAPHARASTTVPAPGEVVRVDLSGTAPGAAGPATAWRAEWGDGVETPWQTSPAFEHAYAQPGLVHARFVARNDAGQSSSVVVAFDVGGTRPTLLSRAFSAENQEVTFFLLGLIVTGTGGAIGLARYRRRRRRLRVELAAIEREFERTRGVPPRCEAMLAARRSRVAALLLDGKLDEAQAATLERRLDALARELRMSMLDDRLDFLPYGMVRQLRSLLADGRLHEWERRQMLAAIEREAHLGEAQKAQVRALLDEWAARDASEQS